MKVVHIIGSLSKVNFGVWNAALFGSAWLKTHREVETVVWIATGRIEHQSLPVSSVRFTGNSVPSLNDLRQLIANDALESNSTVIVTHGCWLLPTRIGASMVSLGFRWIYTPHGMLEPWSMQQGYLKKKLYFTLIEKRCAVKASAIRAVSDVESGNLRKVFRQPVTTIYNGTVIPPAVAKEESKITCVFLGRLHYKKGILPLVIGWTEAFKNEPDFKLIVAGPDDGELSKLQPYFSNNIEYVGAVYGSEKSALLDQSHYFLLPSFSEGFPTTVVEAMSHGVIPLISSGCNFPSVFNLNLGFAMEPDLASIARGLSEIKTRRFDRTMSDKGRKYINDNYSEAKMGQTLFELYQHTLNNG